MILVILGVVFGAYGLLTVHGMEQEAPPQEDANTASVRAHLDRFARELALTPEQETQARAIYEQAGAETTPLQAKLRARWEALGDAVRDNQSAEIETLSDEVGTIEHEFLLRQSEADAAFYALLTEEQKREFDELRNGFGHDLHGPLLEGW